MATSQFAGIIGGPWRSWDLNRLAFHPDLLDLAERFLGSNDLRLYEAELWAKYAGAVDYDQSHHRDFGNHTLVVPKRSDPATQMQSLILLSDVAEEDGPTKVVPLSVGESVPYWPSSLVDGGNDYGLDLPPGRDLRRGGDFGYGAGGDSVLLPARHTASWVAHDRRALSPIHHVRSLRRVGATLDRQSRLARQCTRPQLVRADRAGDAPGALGLWVPRTGRSVLGRADLGRYPGALPPGRLDALPLRAVDQGRSGNRWRPQHSPLNCMAPFSGEVSQFAGTAIPCFSPKAQPNPSKRPRKAIALGAVRVQLSCLRTPDEWS